MRKYPIGIQDFKKIRTEGYHYIDKTPIIHRLIDSGNYYFLSRPRRFGKSLLLSTVKEIFQGNKDLFKGLWIGERWNWERKHPVVHLRLSRINYQKLGLYDALNKEMDVLAEEVGVELEETDLKDKFKELIRKAATTENVVILIDEYDKPIIDYLDDLPKAEENRSVFKSFYSVLKDSDEYIRLLLITGVSRFSKVSIFSDLNNLRDITLSPGFGSICGITQNELESGFAGEINSLQQEDPAILEKIKDWYNGYSWNGTDKVYNPFSLLNFMADRSFRNFWFATGTPTFLVRLLKKRGEYNFENIRQNEMALSEFHIEAPVSAPLLFQTGYLTIKSYDTITRSYILGYPNQEVRDSLTDNLLSAYREVYPAGSAEETGNLLLAVNAGDIPAMISALNSVISSIPYDHWRADTESIFHIITFLTFQKIGVDVQAEVHGSKGRCEVLLKTPERIYAMELKRDGTAREALGQVIAKGYLQPYVSDRRQKLAVGISFSSTDRQVNDYIVKET